MRFLAVCCISARMRWVTVRSTSSATLRTCILRMIAERRISTARSVRLQFGRHRLVGLTGLDHRERLSLARVEPRDAIGQVRKPGVASPPFGVERQSLAHAIEQASRDQTVFRGTRSRRSSSRPRRYVTSAWAVMKITGSRLPSLQQRFVQFQPGLPRHANVEQQAARHLGAIEAMKAARRS